MKVSELLLKYVNRGDFRPRKIGRYWATDVSSIMKGYLTPRSFFEKREINLSGTRMILTGQAMEAQLQKILEETELFDIKYQEKKEIKITNEIVLVVKTDFTFENKFVLETKFPFSPVKMDQIPQRYLHQLECEYRAFYLPVYLGVLTIPFNLKLIPYVPSKRRWKNIQRILEDFHEKVKKVGEEIRIEQKI